LKPATDGKAAENKGRSAFRCRARIETFVIMPTLTLAESRSAFRCRARIETFITSLLLALSVSLGI